MSLLWLRWTPLRCWGSQLWSGWRGNGWIWAARLENTCSSKKPTIGTPRCLKNSAFYLRFVHYRSELIVIFLDARYTPMRWPLLRLWMEMQEVIAVRSLPKTSVTAGRLKSLLKVGHNAAMGKWKWHFYILRCTNRFTNSCVITESG